MAGWAGLHMFGSAPWVSFDGNVEKPCPKRCHPGSFKSPLPKGFYF